jgi:S1-C subfamily serine protease
MSMKVHFVDSKTLLLGDNLFETGYIAVAAETTIKSGTFLKRESGIEFAVVTDTTTEIPVAILAEDLVNESDASVDMSIRPCIKGKVRADMLNVNGTPATDEQHDMIRSYGIIAVKITDLSRLDNH